MIFLLLLENLERIRELQNAIQFSQKTTMSGYVKLTEKNTATPVSMKVFEIYMSKPIEIHLCAKMFALKLTLVLNF